MIRIQELPGGKLYVAKEDVEYKREDAIDPELLRKLNMLRAVDVGCKLDSIGWRIGMESYWVFEDSDNIDEADQTARAAIYLGGDEHNDIIGWRKSTRVVAGTITDK